MDSITVIIVAGGRGTRMGADVPKQFLPLCGKPVLVHTVERFARFLPEAGITVVLPEDQMGTWEAIAEEHGIRGTHSMCAGGQTRYASVRNALAAIGPCDYVAVHDGVRPLVSEELVQRCLDTARRYGSAVPCVIPRDSFRTVMPDGSSRPADREGLRAVQTPQVFRYALLKEAYALPYDPAFTDDASVVERYGRNVALTEGDRSNIKITDPADMPTAEQAMRNETWK